MIYPLKLQPVYKDYIWGGRELEKLGKILPEGIVAESWEVSDRPDGQSIVSNGQYFGCSLKKCTEILEEDLLGSHLSQMYKQRVPILIKFIDASDNLSVQVHPNDEYAMEHEYGEYGKNEMWYVISARPGAKIAYGLLDGVTRDLFEKALKEDKVEEYLNYMEVKPGDVINIPAGTVHSLGAGIVVAEIQQNSNTTYRIYDYGRVDANGNKRELHIDKALDVIDFERKKYGISKVSFEESIEEGFRKSILISNKYFSVEKYEVEGIVTEASGGSQFYVYLFLEGGGSILYEDNSIDFSGGETVMIPAALGEYSLCGCFKALRVHCLESLDYTMQKSLNSSEKVIYDRRFVDA